MHVDVPDALRRHRIENNGDAALPWLAAIPSLVQRAAERWSLQVLPHFEELTYNWVAPAILPDGMHAVLKVIMPSIDFTYELNATRAFSGRMCVRLLEADAENGMLLLERVEPGTMLHHLNDDVAEVSAAAAVMRELRCTPPEGQDFPKARDWLDAAMSPATLRETKQKYPWIQRALNCGAELAASPLPEYLLHGDLHHMNILSARREPYLAIDPHGVIGEPEWEVAPFLFNALRRYPGSDQARIVLRRADQFADELELDRQRLYAWSAIRCVQSAFWSLIDGKMDHDWGAMPAGEVLANAL